MGKSRRLSKKEKQRRRIIAKYTNVKTPASFTSVSKVTAEHFSPENVNLVEDALMSLDSYSKYKPIKRKFTRHKTITGHLDQHWQLDLMDMQALATATGSATC